MVVVGWLCGGCVTLVLQLCITIVVCPSELCVVDCGAHGVCLSGSCHCEEGWAGSECLQRDCHPRCIDHGVCREGKCECHQGWTGEHCTIGRSSHQGLDSPRTPRTPGVRQSSHQDLPGGLVSPHTRRTSGVRQSSHPQDIRG